MPTLIAMEFKKLKRSKVFYIVACTMFLFYLCTAAQGIKSAYSMERMMEETLIYATFLIAPSLFALLGSYMISREYQDDTIKSLAMVPVDLYLLVYAKLIASLLIGIIMFMLLFLFALASVFIVTPDSLVVGFICQQSLIYLLQGVGCFIVVLPIVVFMSRLKNGYWLSVIFTELYSFIGLIAASSKYRNIYPVSAVFSFSGASPAQGKELLVSGLSLALCMASALAILRWQQKYKSTI